jgi:hypothetical protein
MKRVTGVIAAVMAVSAIAGAFPAGGAPLQRLTGRAEAVLGAPAPDPTCPPRSEVLGGGLSDRQRIEATVRADGGLERLIIEACLIDIDNTRRLDVVGSFSLAVRNTGRRISGTVTGFLSLPPSPPGCSAYDFFLTLSAHGNHDLFFAAGFLGPIDSAFLGATAEEAAGNVVHCVESETAV